MNFIIMLLYSCTQLQEGLHFSAFHLNSAGITRSDSTTHSDKTQLMLNPPQAIALDKLVWEREGIGSTCMYKHTWFTQQSSA